MKKHAIIPVFIPHLGCPHTCVFCDQNQITARSKAPSKYEVISFIDEWLTTLGGVETVELAFYGGSFTAIPIELQNTYLEIAKNYKDAGKINKIHLSTRPDAIDRKILDNLLSHSVDIVELGVQSFDDEVLARSERGHDSIAVYKAADLIKSYGMELGIQLMIGLPGDSYESCIYSAKETVSLSPSLARLYPTLILPETKLYDMYESGEYIPLTREEAVVRTSDMYRILDDAGIYIMRVGLKSTDVINSERLGEINSGTYHPAFRQLVEDRIARERICEILDVELLHSSDLTRLQNNQYEGTLFDYASHTEAFESANVDSDILQQDSSDNRTAVVKCHPSWASTVSGHNGENKKFFNENYPDIKISREDDDGIPPGRFIIQII